MATFDKKMTEEPYPYNLPPWRRSYEATSPDGRWHARVEDAWEIFMAGPTKGILSIDDVFQIPDCSPTFVWSNDSRYLAVPQWKYWLRKRQRLLIVDVTDRFIMASRSIYRVLILMTFSDGIICGTDSPLWKPRQIQISLEEAFTEYNKIEQWHAG